MMGRRRGRVMVTAPAQAGTPACAGMQAFVLAFADALRATLLGTGVHVTTVHPREDAPPLVARQAFEGLLRDKGHVHAGSFRSRLRAWWALQFPTAANRRLLRAP
jgi:NADP-dependent 3-hydroxy acid dehydrogenase YdfG